MRKTFTRIISLIMSAVLCIGFTVAVSAFSYPDSFPNTHRNTGKNIADLIAVARTQLGYTELSTSTGYPLNSNQDGGYTKYGAAFGDSTGPWCAYFISWCASQADISSSVVPRIGNCNSAISWYKNRSEYYARSTGYIPKTGDIIFYNWSGGSSAQHIGIVTGVSGNSVFTIEGNTDSSLGFRCAGKTRSRTASYIVGYGVPDYNDKSTYVGSYSFASSVAGGSASHSDSIAYSTSKLSVITTTASDITDTNAVLNGSIKNAGRLYISSAGFLFGTDKDNLKRIAIGVGSSKNELDVTMDLNEKFGQLTPNTTYYYRTFATIDGRDYIGPTYAVVTVDDQPQQLVLSEDSVNVGIGQTAEVMAAQLPIGSKDEGVTWTSADESIATVTNDGIIKGIGFGNVSLTATTNYGSISAKCNVNVLISAPQNIQLINSSMNTVTIEWDKVDGATGYILYRSLEPDAMFKEYKKFKPDVERFTDKDVTPGQHYFYKMMTTAEIEKYNSDKTDTLYTTARLSNPEEICAVQYGSASIQIKWADVADATLYTVYRATDKYGLYTVCASVHCAEYIDRHTLANQQYYYKVVASNNIKNASSDFSEIATQYVKPDMEKAEIDFLSKVFVPALPKDVEAVIVTQKSDNTLKKNKAIGSIV